VTPMGPRLITQIITKHPWSSLRDGLVLSAIMALAVMLARRYDLFTFFAQLADPRRVITPAEAVLLAAIFVGCVWVFISRRIGEERCDEVVKVRLEREMRELRELAMQDPLTLLPNRRALLQALETATARCSGDCARHAFFLLDLNGFKQVNDLYGHAVGDHVLQLVVERFKRAARPSDLLARLGGDEFAVLSYDTDRDAALAIGARFAAALNTAISADGHTHALGVAIGAALCPDDGLTSEAILRRADLAMYRAKERQGSAVALFDPALDTLVSVHGAAS